MKAAFGGGINRAELRVILPGATIFTLQQEVTVTEGTQQEVVVYIGRPWGKGYPQNTRLIGDFYLRDKLYARFSAARLPDGTLLPFCGYLAQWNDPGEGVSFSPSSKPGAMKVLPSQLVGYMTLGY